MATTIKVTEPTRNRIKEIGDRARLTADEVVSRALDEYERALFWQAYRIAAQAEAGSTEVAEEHRAWERTLRDGLDDA